MPDVSNGWRVYGLEDLNIVSRYTVKMMKGEGMLETS